MLVLRMSHPSQSPRTAPAPWGGERLPERQEFKHHRCELRWAIGPEHEHPGAEEEAGGRAGCDGRDVRSLRRPKVFEWGHKQSLMG